MDLRQLRNRPESELTQFKQQLKSFIPPPYIIVILAIIVIGGLGFTVLGLHKSNQMKKEPIKIYKATTPHGPQDRGSEKRPASGSTVVLTDSDSMSEMLTDSLPTEKSSVDTLSETDFEFETSTPTTQSASESPAASEQGSEK